MAPVGAFSTGVSAISAVTVSPVRKRPNLVFRLLTDDASAHGEDTVATLAQVRDQIRGPMTILIPSRGPWAAR